MKHKFNDILELVLEERKNSYKTLRTAAWEKKIAKKILDYFHDIFIEDVNDVRLNRFFLIYDSKTTAVFIAINT